MAGVGRTLGILLGSAIASAASAQPARPLTSSPGPGAPAAMNAMTATMPARVVLSDVVEIGYRDLVLGIVRKPTITTRGTAEEFVCTPAVYEWLLDHPDRVSLAWRRMKVPCVEIADVGNGKFSWADGEGSELTWQVVGRFPDGLVWFATGKVKPAAVTPTVPVKAVVLVSHPKKPKDDGTAVVSPSVQVFLQTDSKAANLVLRVLGPTAPKIAQEGAEQLLFFFGGIARQVQEHPEKQDELLAPAKK